MMNILNSMTRSAVSQNPDSTTGQNLIVNAFLHNSYLEQRFTALEARHSQELQAIQQEKQQLQELLERQSRMVTVLERQLATSTRNSTLLQHQQATLSETLQQLLAMISQCNG